MNPIGARFAEGEVDATFDTGTDEAASRASSLPTRPAVPVRAVPCLARIVSADTTSGAVRAVSCIYWPHNDASLFPLPAEADALLGANPTLTIVDELGVVTKDVFDAMRVATGKRAESLLLAIGTPPSEPESVMRTLVEHGR